jgi:hypothetical protein
MKYNMTVPQNIDTTIVIDVFLDFTHVVQSDTAMADPTLKYTMVVSSPSS